MIESRLSRGWVLPVLLAVAVTTAAGFAFLYFTRGTGELGAIRVVVTEEGNGDANAFTVYVGEAPFVQKETLSPGPKSSGVVNYPAPYRLKPHLRLNSKDRRYDIVTETEFGFTWMARHKLDDLVEDARKLKEVDALLERPLELLKERMRPGIVYEDFTWEAKGLRALPNSIPPQTYQQTGKFNVIHGTEGMVGFPIPYATTPNVEVGGFRGHTVVVVEVTPTHFKWKNVGIDAFGNDGEAVWTSRGVLPANGEPKK